MADNEMRELTAEIQRLNTLLIGLGSDIRALREDSTWGRLLEALYRLTNNLIELKLKP